MMAIRLGIVFILLVLVGSVQNCYVTGFIDLNIMERFVQSDYVVLGQTTSHVVNTLEFNGRIALLTDARFTVHCILKGPEEMREQVTISGISPRYGCSGTNIQDIMAINTTSIVALSKKSTDIYSLHEVMPTLSAGIEPYKLHFSSISNVCGLQNWRAPSDANSSMCPVCGTSNYSTDALTHPDTSSLQTCFHSTSQTVTDMTTCELFLPTSIAAVEAQTCIPSTYNQQCVTLTYRNANVSNCDCNRNADGSIFTDGSNQMVVSTFLLSALALLWAIVF